MWLKGKWEEVSSLGKGNKKEIRSNKDKTKSHFGLGRKREQKLLRDKRRERKKKKKKKRKEKITGMKLGFYIEMYGYMSWVVWNLSIVLYGNYGSIEVWFWSRQFRYMV